MIIVCQLVIETRVMAAPAYVHGPYSRARGSCARGIVQTSRVDEQTRREIIKRPPLTLNPRARVRSYVRETVIGCTR